MPGLSEAVRQLHSDDLLSVRELNVDSFEQLAAATPTSRSEIIQVDAGRMRGRLKHAAVAGLSLGFGSFSRGLISREIYSDDRVTIGFLFDGRTDAKDAGIMENIRAWAPGTEHERRHGGSASFGAISASIEDLSGFFGRSSRLPDPLFWRKRNCFRTDPKTGSASAEALRNIMRAFERRASILTARHAEFWKRAILEAATAAVADTELSAGSVVAALRLVRRTQEIVEASPSVPIHLSQLANSLNVSRSTLHRAFDQTLGLSPMSYLRSRRLCQARIMLREEKRSESTVADIAFDQGFADPSRFASDYHALFGEYPSETLTSARSGRAR
jgi:AraC-like DNA-binding protein